jgi:nitroreductase
MDVKDAIEKRRNYRSLVPAKITDELINDLAHSAQLAPSCFNNQPWRYVFVDDKKVLKDLQPALSKGNEWVFGASLIIAVVSNKEMDCVVKGREYFLFDVGTATAFLILRATELGLVAHAIAGFDEQKVKEVLNIPEEMTVITLVNVGRHSEKMSSLMSEKQIAGEKDRPERIPLSEFAFRNSFKK